MNCIFLLLLLICNIATTNTELVFASIGDWGSYTLGEPYSTNQIQVSNAMAMRCEIDSCAFILNCGDNFYSYGVNSVNDPLWKSDYENIYHQQSLLIPWYNVLGNHDYGRNPEAQIQYKSVGDRWKFPSRYYNWTQYINGAPGINFIMLDTSPCINDYWKLSNKTWDPKNIEFHKNIIQENCYDQSLWLEETLNYYDRPIIIVGHHPIYELNNISFDNIIKKKENKILTGVFGHDHVLQHFTLKNIDIEFFISGAGSRVMHRHNTELKKNIIYMNYTNGFIIHTYNENHKTLMNEFYDYDGNKIYNFSLTTNSDL